MDRRLLFPAVAATAWAQQTSPAAAEAEKALRERVQQFYQLQQDKKYRQAESMVADDTKDDYYNGKKQDIKSFVIDRVELMDDNSRARVTIKTKVLMLIPGATAQVFEMPTPTTWKIEGGEWRWYISPEVRMMTPFGKLQKAEGQGNAALDAKGQAPGGIANPDLHALQSDVKIDRTAVTLNVHEPNQPVIITNSLPGPLDLRIDPHANTIQGLTVDIDKTHLNTGESATVMFRWKGSGKISDVVQITALPLNRPFDIRVTAQ